MKKLWKLLNSVTFETTLVGSLLIIVGCVTILFFLRIVTELTLIFINIVNN